MLRKLALAAALTAATVSAPALAQSSGGITFTFGTGGYNSYDYDDDYDEGGYYDYRPQYGQRYGYSDPYAQRRYQRELQLYQWRLQQWRQEQQRRLYWEQQRRNGGGWYHDDDD